MKFQRSVLQNHRPFFSVSEPSSALRVSCWVPFLGSVCRRAWCVLPLVSILFTACGDSDPADGFEDASVRRDGQLIGHKRHDGGMREDASEQMPEAHYTECSGPPYGQGTCESDQICAAMPRVPFKYCMPRPPCDDGMVEVMQVACAYPCEKDDDCAQFSLPHCAPNDLAELTGDETKGWCTP